MDKLEVVFQRVGATWCGIVSLETSEDVYRTVQYVETGNIYYIVRFTISIYWRELVMRDRLERLSASKGVDSAIASGYWFITILHAMKVT